MSGIVLQRILSFMLVGGILVGFVTPVEVQSGLDAVLKSSLLSTERIESTIFDELASNDQTDFFVWMAEKANLSPADKIKTKLEKGRFVFNALYTTAERTQKDLRAFLDEAGVEYQAFYIANKILVRSGDINLLTILASRPDIARITANHKYQLVEPLDRKTTIDTATAVEPNLTFINADDVWAMGVNGAGTVMAGNDTGLDVTHSAIAPHYRGCVDPPACTTWDHNYNWWDATGEHPIEPYDGFGHGTHTTGTMIGDDNGGNQIGVAPGATTIHCKNMTDWGSGDDTTFTECFQWDLAPWDLSGANPNPAMAPDAVNNSWGYWGGNQPLFKDEIQALHAAGILVEVSAGGEGSYCQSLRSPADYWEVLTTGSVNHANPFPGTLSNFSGRGPSELDEGYFPDIMAPGENIRSSVPDDSYEYWSGTSTSGPHATALVGLMWQACPSLRGMVYPTIDYIHQAAAPLTGQYGSNCGGDYIYGPNNDWGGGTIDALASVQLAIDNCTGVLGADWEKEVWINGDGPYDPVEMPFGVLAGDEVVIVDEVLVTSTTTVNFWLMDAWDVALDLTGWEAGDGTVVTETNVLTWELTEGISETWYVITKTFEVQEGDWTVNSLSETLLVDGLGFQPEPVEVIFEHLMPEISVPYAVETNLYQGEMVTQSLNIINEGDIDLEWTVAVTPEISWLSVDPINGSTQPGEGTQVVLNFNAGNLDAGVYTTTLEITSNDLDESTTNILITLTVVGMADLRLEQEDSNDPVHPGDAVTYTLHVYNDGPGDAGNVIVVDTLPVSATFISASSGCSEAGGIVICMMGTLSEGQEVIIYIVVQAQGTTGEMVNDVTISSDTYDPWETNNTDTETTVIEEVLRIILPIVVKR